MVTWKQGSGWTKLIDPPGEKRLTWVLWSNTQAPVFNILVPYTTASLQDSSGVHTLPSLGHFGSKRGLTRVVMMLSQTGEKTFEVTVYERGKLVLSAMFCCLPWPSIHVDVTLMWTVCLSNFADDTFMEMIVPVGCGVLLPDNAATTGKWMRNVSRSTVCLSCCLCFQEKKGPTHAVMQVIIMLCLHIRRHTSGNTFPQKVHSIHDNICTPSLFLL